MGSTEVGIGYGTPYEREVLDIFTCIRHRKTLDTAGRLLSRNAERHLHTAVEMHRLFYDYPEAIANTRELSDRLQFQMTGLGYEFPAYPPPDGETMDSFLRKRVDEGMRRRYLAKNDPALYEKAKRQAERELRLIEKLGLAGYFLIVWDVVCFCKDNGILIQGRGSRRCKLMSKLIIEPPPLGSRSSIAVLKENRVDHRLVRFTGSYSAQCIHLLLPCRSGRS
jgi:error-prone DNA polymerase